MVGLSCPAWMNGIGKLLSSATDLPDRHTGLFLYHSDAQETDIEWLGPSEGDPVNDDRRGVVHFVNQAVEPGKSPTHTRLRCPADASTAIHEYRIDWTPQATFFYLDGELRETLSTNVPSKAGRWMWNCWTYANPLSVRCA